MPSSETDPTTQNKRWILYAVLVAIAAWLALSGIVRLAVNTLTKVLFFTALFLAVSSTLMPAVAYLNTRFGQAGHARFHRVRSIRQSIYAGLFVVAIAWLQMLRVLNLTITLILVGVFVLIETFLITRELPPKRP